MSRLTCILFLSILTYCASAQKVSITVTGIPRDSVKVYLEGFYGTDKFSVDSFQLKNKIERVVKLPARSGIYTLRSAKDGEDCFFVSAADTLIKIAANYPELLAGKIKVQDSRENEALKLLLREKESFHAISDSMEQRGTQVDEFDARYDSLSRMIRTGYEKYCADFNGRLQQLAANYPNTYTAMVLVPTLLVSLPDAKQQRQFDNIKSFTHYHFFDHMPLGNEGIISNPFFEERLADYVTFYVHRRNEEKLKKDLVYMQDSLTESAAVKEYIRYALLKHYLKKGSQEIVNFLTEKSAAEGCENNSPYQTNATVKNLLAIAPGKPAPQLALQDYNGSSRSLSGVMFGKKAGVIVFWASWCGHCRDSIPVFYDWYKQYRDKGFEVYSVSIDNDIRDWVAFTEAYTPDWVNVSELKGWESPSAVTYGIRSTPTFVVIDENRNILLKTNSQLAAKEKLEAILKKK